MMRPLKFLFIFSFMTWCGANAADTTDSIIQSGEYYYGTGVSRDENEASDAALNELMSQISVTVSSAYEGRVTEVNGSVDQSAKLVIKSHSQATLRNVQTLKQNVRDGIKVFLYIRKSEVSRIFEERKRLVWGIYSKATEWEEEGNIGYALKWYYFAAILLNSLPERTVSSGGVNLTTEIPHRIINLLLNTEFSCISADMPSEKEKLVTLLVTCKGKPVSNLEFTFWDGAGQVSGTAQDGKAVIPLMGGSINFKNLDIDIKYSFYECREEIKEVAELWKVVEHSTFKNTKKVMIKAESTGPKAPVSVKSVTAAGGKISGASDGVTIELSNREDCPMGETVLAEIFSFLSNMKTGRTDAYVGDPFLAKKTKRLFEYNNPTIAEFVINADINKTTTGWEVRKIPVLSRYSSIRKQAFENLIFDFGESGKLQDVNFAIMGDLYNSFVEQATYGNDWGNRQIIIKFIERYRTAYMTRDLDTISKIFSDNALIIVGRMLQTKQMQADVQYEKLNERQPQYEYLRFTKDQYLKRQERIFETQRDIFLGFSTFKITPHNNFDGVYGVSMRQHYLSTGYADEGHLFLYISFREKDPLIYVRAWQPQEWDRNAIVDMANFELFK